MVSRLPVGKLPADLLADLLPQLPGGPRVVLGPRPGEDAAVLDMSDRYLVAKTDPITFATDMIGWYAVQINTNDLVTTGATPLWFMATILLPTQAATADMARMIFDQIGSACRELGIAVVGGHTEITHGLDRPIVVGSLLGEVAKDALVRTGGAKPGDVIYLTKGAPIEATAIIAREKRDLLQTRFDSAMLDRCANFLHDPGISVLRDAQIARAAGGVTGMHDPTEGGVITALWEVADASGCRMVVDLYGEHTPWLSDAAALCKVLDLDPASAIASGSLLLTITPDRASAVEAAFEAHNVALYRIGTVQADVPAVIDVRRGLMERPERDEIAKLYD